MCDIELLVYISINHYLQAAPGVYHSGRTQLIIARSALMRARRISKKLFSLLLFLFLLNNGQTSVRGIHPNVMNQCQCMNCYYSLCGIEFNNTV